MGVESETRSIGEMARDSGLSVSALRFYDRGGVLVPTWVDPVSGYRWYGPGQLDEARLLARLRRAAMPLADIRLVLARRRAHVLHADAGPSGGLRAGTASHPAARRGSGAPCQGTS